MRFSDLVSLDRRPAQAEVSVRTPIDTDTYLDVITDDARNNGFVTGLVDRGRGTRMRATRRGFLRGTIATAAAATAVSAAQLFGPSRRVEAQTGIVGTYPRRILQFCPPYNANDQCQPGCGSSPICTDCCTSDGYFRNDPANGYSLYPGQCGDGGIADGWIWRYKGTCGNCSEIEYRCSDGYVKTDTGPAPFICRYVTDCVPLGEGEPSGTPVADAARPTNWRPAGSLELAVDNVGSVTLNGWIADGSGRPISMRVTANGSIVHLGTAALARPDIERTVRGAGPNTGFAVTFPLEPGQYRLCVDALSGVLTATIGCVNMNVGSGGSVRGSGTTGSISPAPTATRTPTPPAPTPDATGATPAPAPSVTPGPSPTTTAVAGALALPVAGEPSASPTYGAAQVIRRSGATTGFASGWAGDVDTGQAAYIDVTIGGESVAVARAELPRPDVHAAFERLGPAAGFAVTFPLPESEVEVCVDAVGADDGMRRPLGCRLLGAAPDQAVTDELAAPSASGAVATPPPVVFGAVDAVSSDGRAVTVTGWAFDPADHARVVEVAVSSGSSRATTETGAANEHVREVYGVASDCGFEVTLDLPSGSAALVVVALAADGAEVVLGRSTVDVP